MKNGNKYSGYTSTKSNMASVAKGGDAVITEGKAFKSSKKCSPPTNMSHMSHKY